jgi:hypothetical protein
MGGGSVVESVEEAKAGDAPTAGESSTGENIYFSLVSIHHRLVGEPSLSHVGDLARTSTKAMMMIY